MPQGDLKMEQKVRVTISCEALGQERVFTNNNKKQTNKQTKKKQHED